MDLPEEVTLPDPDKVVSDAFDPSKGKPGDWKQNSRWKDTYYCDVEDIVDYDGQIFGFEFEKKESKKKKNIRRAAPLHL